VVPPWDRCHSYTIPPGIGHSVASSTVGLGRATICLDHILSSKTSLFWPNCKRFPAGSQSPYRMWWILCNELLPMYHAKGCFREVLDRAGGFSCNSTADIQLAGYLHRKYEPNQEWAFIEWGRHTALLLAGVQPVLRMEKSTNGGVGHSSAPCECLPTPPLALLRACATGLGVLWRGWGAIW
jgi:hypothetical protein